MVLNGGAPQPKRAGGGVDVQTAAVEDGDLPEEGVVDVVVGCP